MSDNCIYGTGTDMYVYMTREIGVGRRVVDLYNFCGDDSDSVIFKVDLITVVKFMAIVLIFMVKYIDTVLI